MATIVRRLRARITRLQISAGDLLIIARAVISSFALRAVPLAASAVASGALAVGNIIRARRRNATVRARDSVTSVGTILVGRAGHADTSTTILGKREPRSTLAVLYLVRAERCVGARGARHGIEKASDAILVGRASNAAGPVVVKPPLAARLGAIALQTALAVALKASWAVVFLLITRAVAVLFAAHTGVRIGIR